MIILIVMTREKYTKARDIDIKCTDESAELIY